MRWLRENGLTLTIALFLVSAGSILGQRVAGWHVANDDAPAWRTADELVGLCGQSDFLSSVFENCESELLQMAAYVVLTAILFQRGSADLMTRTRPIRAIRILQRKPGQRTHHRS